MQAYSTAQLPWIPQLVHEEICYVSCYPAACSLTSKQSSQEQGADKQRQQWILVLAIGTLAVELLQMRIEAVLKVRVPEKCRKGKLRVGTGPADVFMCFHAHLQAPQVSQHNRCVSQVHLQCNTTCNANVVSAQQNTLAFSLALGLQTGCCVGQQEGAIQVADDSYKTCAPKNESSASTNEAGQYHKRR